jgi:glycosyltransferase involved in cell wall biosynthesis
MKIACLSTSQVPSTTANSIQLMKVCQALAQQKDQVRLWVPGNKYLDWEELARHYGLDSSGSFDMRWLQTWSIFKRYDFALLGIHQAQVWGADLIYTWLPQVATRALSARMPAVLELHDHPTGVFGPHLVRQFARLPGKKRLLVITRALRERLEQEYRVSFNPGEILIAPNGTELEHYVHLPDPGTARLQLGFTDRQTAIYTGHFYSGRGMELLLGLAQALPDVHFIWVGGRTEDVAAWKTRLEDTGIRNVTLTGFIDNRSLPLYQAAGDVLLMPYERKIAGSSGGNSAEICSPMKMFDYLACGRAILSSDLPVLHEVLNESNAAFCIPGDLADWIKTLKELLADGPRRARLAEQAQRDAARYTWNERARRALEGFRI